MWFYWGMFNARHSLAVGRAITLSRGLQLHLKLLSELPVQDTFQIAAGVHEGSDMDEAPRGMQPQRQSKQLMSWKAILTLRAKPKYKQGIQLHSHRIPYINYQELRLLKV